MSNENVNRTATELKAKAIASARPVRVIVAVQPSPEWPESMEPKTMMRARAQVTAIMRGAGVALVQPIEGTPLIVMELSAAQIDLLLCTGMVRSLQEDKPERAFDY